MKLKEIVICALLTSLLFVQEQLLASFPNIQLTIFLVFLYSKVLPFKQTFLIITIHVLLDNLIAGSFTPLITIPMFIGYLIILIITKVFLKNAKKPLFLALNGIIFAICYSLSFMLANFIFLEINPVLYIIGDIPFTLLLSVSSFLSIFLLYKPFYKLLYNFVNE